MSERPDREWIEWSEPRTYGGSCMRVRYLISTWTMRADLTIAAWQALPWYRRWWEWIRP